MRVVAWPDGRSASPQAGGRGLEPCRLPAAPVGGGGQLETARAASWSGRALAYDLDMKRWIEKIEDLRGTGELADESGNEAEVHYALSVLQNFRETTFINAPPITTGGTKSVRGTLMLGEDGLWAWNSRELRLTLEDGRKVAGVVTRADDPRRPVTFEGSLLD